MPSQKTIKPTMKPLDYRMHKITNGLNDSDQLICSYRAYFEYLIQYLHI